MPNENFQSTHWSVVKAVGLGDTNGRIALENLYLSYRAPLLAFVRSKGYSKEDSEDIVQGLFESLVNLNSWRLASPDRGRFRSFLLGAVKHFIANQYKRNNASKRGGNFSFVSWEELPESVSEGILASSEDSPEKLYDRVWGTVILEKAKSM